MNTTDEMKTPNAVKMAEKRTKEYITVAEEYMVNGIVRHVDTTQGIYTL